MSQAQEMLQTLSERLAATANVRQVFGEPVQANGRTIIPVARIHYRLGAGAGSGETKDDSQSGSRSGGGGGGGGLVIARPIGALEITDAGTRFIHFADLAEIIKASVGGLLALLLLRRLMRKRS